MSAQFPNVVRAVQAAHAAGHPPLSAGAIAAACKAETKYWACHQRLRILADERRNWEVIA